MNNEGLYYYKLVSPYSDDVTKNCKLTVNEIDTNFLHLKDMDIRSAEYDNDTMTIILTRNNGDKLVVDISDIINNIEQVVPSLVVDYDELDGSITINYGGQVTKIDGLITEKTLDDCRAIISDGTIVGNGSPSSPLGINPLELTGQFRPAYKFIDMTKEPPESLPDENALGDRYVTLEKGNRAGYLYNFAGVQEIAGLLELLNNGWRIPTKEDWDNMLNAVEICDQARNHNSDMANIQLGQLAGKFLKSLDKEYVGGREIGIWNTCDDDITVGCCGCDDVIVTTQYQTVVDEDGDELNMKTVTPSGIDSYGFRVLPTGYYDGCSVKFYCGDKGGLWTSTISQISDVYIKRFDANKAGVVQIAVSPKEMHGLRLVKDFNGSNFHENESILGTNYKTVLMPSENAVQGYTVWTASNFMYETEEGTYDKPGDCLDELTEAEGDTYYMNYWNGFCWEKKPIEEGDSIVLLLAYTDGSGHTYTSYAEGLTAVHDVEFRIIDSKLVAVNDQIFTGVMDGITSNLQELNQKVEDLSGQCEQAHEEIIQMITDEIDRATSAETELSNNIAILKEDVYQLSGTVEEVYEIVEEYDTRIDDLQNQIGTGFTQEEGDVIHSTVREYTDYIAGRLINSGSTFSVSEGFAFSHDDASNNYTLYLDSNYGEIPEE